MLCTKCGEDIKPIVAIDIDGTLGDYHGHLLDFAEQYLATQRYPRTYNGAQNFGDWFCQRYGVDRRTYRDIKLAFRQGGQKRSLPVYAYSQMLINTLFDKGAEIWLTTTRPYLRLDSVDPDTRFWLGRHGFKFNHLLYDVDKYQRLADIVDESRVVAVLDDLAEMYDAAEDLYGKDVPILRQTQWNSAVNRPNVAVGLIQAYKMIEERFREWQEAHNGV